MNEYSTIILIVLANVLIIFLLIFNYLRSNKIDLIFSKIEKINISNSRSETLVNRLENEVKEISTLILQLNNDYVSKSELEKKIHDFDYDLRTLRCSIDLINAMKQ